MSTQAGHLLASWQDLLLFVAVGFAAQIIDGAIGMAYKVTSSALLLSLGVPPAGVSAAVHTAGSVTSAASGLAHWRLGNIDPRLLVRLAVPGMVGGVLGGLVLAKASADLIRPWISAYLLLLGLFILWKALGGVRKARSTGTTVAPLGFVGGLLDAIGGGGWGPIVTTTLVGHGVAPRSAIGSANSAEFFVTLAITGTLIATVGVDLWPIVLALIAGGVIAAPFAALATRHLPERVLITLVAVVIVALSSRTLILAVAA